MIEKVCEIISNIITMSQTFTSKQYLSQMNLIYFVQAGVMLIFAIVIFVLVYSVDFVPTADKGLAEKFTYALIVVVIVGFLGAHFFYQQLLSRIDKSLDLKKKMPRYLGALLIRSACLELPGLLASVVFFLTANFYLLFIPVFTAVAFYVLRPTISTIAEDLQLSEQEKSQLSNPQAIVAER